MTYVHSVAVMCSRQPDLVRLKAPCRRDLMVTAHCGSLAIVGLMAGDASPRDFTIHHELVVGSVTTDAWPTYNPSVVYLEAKIITMLAQPCCPRRCDLRSPCAWDENVMSARRQTDTGAVYGTVSESFGLFYQSPGTDLIFSSFVYM